MIARVWPGDEGAKRAALGDWRTMPFAAAGYDAVIGDNCLAFLSYPDGLEQVVAQVRRVLRPDGLAVFRVFVAPQTPPSDDDLIRFAYSLKGKSQDAFRWRIAMHTANCAPTPNVLANDVWLEFRRLFPKPEELLRANGWEEGSFSVLELYRGSEMMISFPTVDELSGVALRQFGQMDLHSSGDYPMSEHCPFVVLRGFAAT